MKFKLKRIDWYIIKQFLGTYVFAIALIISISVVFDINEKLDDFLNPDVPLKAIVFDYYMNFIPYFINLFSPLFTFIAVIFFTSKLADRSEIIAMLASGMSFRRLMLPYGISAAVIAIVTYILNAYIIPPANITRIDFQNKYIKNKETKSVRNAQLEVEPGVIAYFDNFQSSSNMGYRFSLEHFENKKLVSRLTAKSIKYDSLYTWTIIDYVIRDFDGTVIVVSHDREFLDGLVSKVYEFGGGLVKEHLGGIYDFLQKKNIESLQELQRDPVQKTSVAVPEKEMSSSRLSYEQQKEQQKKIRKLEKSVAECEQRINRLEEQIAELESRMATPEGAADAAIYEQHGALKKELDQVVDQWECVSMELEEAKG